MMEPAAILFALTIGVMFLLVQSVRRLRGRPALSFDWGAEPEADVRADGYLADPPEDPSGPPSHRCLAAGAAIGAGIMLAAAWFIIQSLFLPE